MNIPAHEILPGIWLGNVYASKDTFWQKQNKISAIINCTKDLPFSSTDLSLYRIPVHDNLEREEIRNLELWSFEIVYKISNEVKKGNHILIHCAAGMQRSAACLAMYLIAITRCTTDEAITFIRNKRSIAFTPKANFYDSIKGFETQLRNQIGDSVKDPNSQWKRIPLPT